LSRIHSIEIEDDKYPQDFKEILKILGNALLDQKTKKTMEIEDEILEELKLREERRLRLERQWQAKLSLKEKELEEKEKELEEKDKELEKKNKQLEENKHKLKETAKMLKELGVDISIIIQKTGLTEEEVRSV
jgi:DNA repair exonuclease SbcCD ATPase subunit